MQEVTLYDLYHGKDVVIKLKKDLSPQDNAAHYYRKQRNIKSENATRHDTLMRAQTKLEYLQSDYEQVIKASQASDLKPFMKQQWEKEKSLPFKVYEKNGYTIWVGKNASSNDVLTTQYAQKNDMWLHAKDVSGSHVVIKQQGAHFPNDVIHYAAQLAAYYSKLKGSSLVPVCYTLKKYVRKPKGMEPGQVVVDREEVMLVEPYIHDK
jgi:predicted ribosome quality control (RQC) complex YloA/Tae2 family protein